jgi:hypothetical protein
MGHGGQSKNLTPYFCQSLSNQSVIRIWQFELHTSAALRKLVKAGLLTA